MRNLVEKQLSWLALLVTAFYSLLGSCRSADTSQECGHERLMNCARPLERINSDDLSLTIMKDGQNQLCSEFESSIKCIQTFTIDCLEENQREHFNNLYAGTNKAVMELCQDGPFLDELVKHADCMHKMEPQHELCQKRYQRIIEEVAKQKHNVTDQSMKRVCCGFKEYLDCSHHTARRHCGDDTAQFTKEFLDRVSGSLLGTYCKPFTEKVCGIGSGASISRILTAVPVALVLLARYFT
ncbi:uncharacterized protein LOC143213065 [Lasioglossum baleicum]|uniref:uncharacterized protein LOC143213065 n=1 Tax=Lasioglossum baleicum TaxID=434251 RepID=UPI003FCCA580